MSSPSEVLQRYHDEVKSKHNVDAVSAQVRAPVDSLTDVLAESVAL